jgi:hypothetical protein
MENQGKILQPPHFTNGPNGCPSTTVYQLFISLLLSQDIEFDYPSADYPSKLIGEQRKKEGLNRGDFAAGKMGDALSWLQSLMENPIDDLSGQISEFLGKPMQIIRRLNKQNKWDTGKPVFYPVFKLEGGNALRQDINEALEGSVGERTVIGNVFKRVPRVLFVELPFQERQWHSKGLELEVYTRDFRITKKTHKVIANMCGFICDHSGHYTAVVHYGDERNKEWWHMDCLRTIPCQINWKDAVALYKKYGYIAAFSCEKQ